MINNKNDPIIKNIKKNNIILKDQFEKNYLSNDTDS